MLLLPFLPSCGVLSCCFVRFGVSAWFARINCKSVNFGRYKNASTHSKGKVFELLTWPICLEHLLYYVSECLTGHFERETGELLNSYPNKDTLKLKGALLIITSGDWHRLGLSWAPELRPPV